MIHLAFDVPVPHATDFLDLMDFHVARYDVALADVKYRQKLQPIGLLVAPPAPIEDLRKAITLTRAQHVTVYPPLDDKEAHRFIDEHSAALESELAVVVPIGGGVVYRVAVKEDVSIIYLPPHDGRLIELMDLIDVVPLKPWIHFAEVTSAQELRDIIDLKLPHASLHTNLPIREACGGELSTGQVLTREQIGTARELMQAMREVCR